MPDKVLVGKTYAGSAEEIVGLIRREPSPRNVESNIDALGGDLRGWEGRPDLRIPALVALTGEKEAFRHFRAAIVLAGLVKANRPHEVAFVDGTVTAAFLRCLEGHPYAAKAAAEGLGALAAHRPELVADGGDEIVAALAKAATDNTDTDLRMTYKHEIYDAALDALRAMRGQARLARFMSAEAKTLLRDPLPPGRMPADRWVIFPHP